MRSSRNRKLITGLISVVGAALLAMSVLTVGALAAPNPGPPLTNSSGEELNQDGPQTSNIPYVAWVGENVRLVVCDKEIQPGEAGTKLQFATFSTEDWSGYQFQPPSPDGFSGNNLFEAFDAGPSAFFASSESAHKGDGCVATVYKSLNPGLARIKVDVREQEDPGNTVFSYQFLVIWLTANKPVLHEASLTGEESSEVFQGKLDKLGKENLSTFLGDPTGNGELTPSPFSGNPEEEDLGLVQVKVSGNFPVKEEAPLHNLLPDEEYTLPVDWAELAGVLSSSSETTDEPGDDPGLWDIHGSPAQSTFVENGAGETFGEETAFGMLGENKCKEFTPLPLPVSLTSSTDNCNEGYEHFSRVFGDLTSGATATVGPFDPQLANQTLLSDGRLNEYDAPMPAMRIDVAIAPSEEGIGGVGTFQEIRKAKVYSHDFEGDSLHNNLYNPYYSTYLPATDRPGFNEDSGIAGPVHGNDFPGFLNAHPDPYHFWEFVPSYTSEHSNRVEEKTKCLKRVTPGNEVEYESPKGHLIETLYTDENGEAYVVYKPGDAFYLNRLVGKGIEKTADGCDLEGVYNKEIGKAVISAKAIYPYQPVDYPAAESENTLEKKIISKWQKEWYVFPKCKSANCESVRIIIAKAQDIDGKPIEGEKVCFSVNGFLGAEPYYGEPGSMPVNTFMDPEEIVFGKGSGKKVLYLGGTGLEEKEGVGELCLHTNDEGLAAIELDNGSFAGVDLTVNYKDEGIIRDHAIDPAVGTVVTGGSTPAPPGGGSTTDPGTTGAASTNTNTTVTVIETVAGSAAAPGNTVAVVVAKAKPLTAAQKLHRELDACKKLKTKKKRVACESKARRAYDAKVRSSQAKAKK
jgi:hypothetical protein